MRKPMWVSNPWIVILFSIAFFSSSLAQDNLPGIIKRIEPSVVVILTYDKEGKSLLQGSGFFISKEGDVITNRHVIQGASRAEVKTAKGVIYTVLQVAAEDKVADIVRISVDIQKSTVEPLSLSNALPETGERVIVIGSPFGLERTVADGIVSAVREIPGFGNIIQISAPISPGSSGSPVVNIKGEVIGVATFQMVEGQNLNFAIPGEKVARLKTGKEQTINDWGAIQKTEWLSTAEGLYSEGLVLLWAEEYKKALQYFEKAINKNPDYAEAFNGIGYCNEELGRYIEAIEAYKQSISIKTDFEEAHYNLGVTYHVLGRYNEAVEAFKQAIRIKPDFALAHSNLGASYGKLGRYIEAIEAYKQSIRLKPDFALAHYNLGASYGKLGRYSEAIEAYLQAIRLKPDYTEAHYNMGLDCDRLGRYSEAVEAFKQAIRIKPDYAEAHLGLGLTYLMLGDKGFALEEYKILKNLNPDLANKLFNVIYK